MPEVSNPPVCIVTGGSLGIGAAICQRFIAGDYLVFNLDVQPPTDKTLGTKFIQCDVSNRQSVTQAIDQVLAKTSRIDVLVSNAGIHHSGHIEDTSEEQFDRVMSINVKGAMYASQSVLPVMREQQQGAIIYIASDQALIAKHNSFAYNLSKAALASMAKTTALDYAKFNIRANAVCPGTIETPLYHTAIDKYVAKSGSNKQQVHDEEKALQPLNRLGQPSEVAALTFFLASPDASFITGSLQVIDGGYTAQ